MLQGNFEEADKAYKQCLSINPLYPQQEQVRFAYYWKIANSADSSKLLQKETMEKVRTSLKNDSSNARLWYVLGLLYSRLGDSVQALKSYQKADGIDNSLPGLKNAIDSLSNSEQPSKSDLR